MEEIRGTINPKLSSDLRIGQNKAEQQLWDIMQTGRFGVKFEKQRSVAGHIVDFVSLDAWIIVEIEEPEQKGHIQHLNRLSDFERAGYNIIRFSVEEVLADIELAVGKIAQFITDNPPDAGLKHNRWRADFPALAQIVNGQKIVYLDSGASAQKPKPVLDAIQRAYEVEYANIHRGLYRFSQVKTEEFEAVRGKVARFIGAPSDNTIVFTRNTTEAINLVAQSWGRGVLRPGDEIILTQMEHHANIVPWQMVADQTGSVIKVIPVLENGTLDVAALPSLLSAKTRMVAFTHISNALGTINPAADIIKTVRAHNKDIKILVDGSQAVVHMAVNVKALDADFYVFTGHKLYGPTGVGVLYGKYDILARMQPYQGGGDMIEAVSFNGTTFKEPPYKFEAGTPAIAEVIALGAAIDYVTNIGIEKIAAHEQGLLDYANRKLSKIDGLKMYGTAPQKAAILSFRLDGVHISDVAMVLDQMGIAVRSGHHCCMPLMERFGIEGTVRASCGLYTSAEDIDRLVSALEKAKSMFR